jgi:NhaP-type Na+/H+ or K+/H+ antiporter
MRGGLSLAAALALPLTLDGAPFPHRDLLIFVTFVVIVVTLVLPGLTLPLLIERLGLGEEDGRAEQDAQARAEIARAALARLNQLASAPDADASAVAQLQAVYEARLRRLEIALDSEHAAPDYDPDAYRTGRADVLATERAALARLRHDGLPDEIARDIERDLDLEEARVKRQRPIGAPTRTGDSRPDSGPRA